MIDNNNVYVDNKNNFYTVLNDEDYGYFEIENLKAEGFHFVGDCMTKEDEESLLEEIKTLPIDKQIELLELVEEKAQVMKEFRFDLESHQEEFIEWYGYFDKEEFNEWLQEEVIPERLDLDWHDIETVCEYLMQYKKEFLFYELRGYSQGDIAYVWNTDTTLKLTKEYLESVCFDSWINIYTSNEEGDILDNLEDLPGYYISNEGANVYLNEYMKEKYNAWLADYEVTYKQ